MNLNSFFTLLVCLSSFQSMAQDKILLNGTWEVKLDPTDIGIKDMWWKTPFKENAKMPGSLTENGLGDDISLETPWTANIVDSTYFKSEYYSKYRKNEVKLPFWLTPKKYYRGVAWYRREINIPADWKGKHIILNLERCHWETSVYVNGNYCGTLNSLVAPHRFDVSPYITEKTNQIVVRVNNNYVIPIGLNSSSITDHTQTNWNGMIGELSLMAYHNVQIKDVIIVPDVDNGNVVLKYQLNNTSNKEKRGFIKFEVQGFPHVEEAYSIKSIKKSGEVVYKIPGAKLWDEFTPNLYTLKIELIGDTGELLEKQSMKFGMRKIAIEDGRIAINNKPIFLRGDVDCAGFPLTGYPSMDANEWERIYKIMKAYGLNHLRFHSWCPPKVAFEVADQLGIYLYAESPAWSNQTSAVGTGGIVDEFIYSESEKMISEYGNHPSFIMMSYGNEPGGGHRNRFLTEWVDHFKSKDSRRLYTSGAGWPQLEVNDFHVMSDNVRIQAWGGGLKSIINSKQPSFNYNWQKGLNKVNKTVVSHEIGQWCAYPNFKEISKYKGVLQAKNFELFKETLENNGMGNQADDFLYASGRLQTLCYKADIEAALRTPKFGGFQLLGLHDFSGQGTALVGALDVFWESKGYTTPEEYKTFCDTTVLLAKFPKLIYLNNERIETPLDIAHFGSTILKNNTIKWVVTDETNKLYAQGSFKKDEIKIGDSQFIGNIKFELSKIKEAKQLKVAVKLAGTTIHNFWDIWVYPHLLKPQKSNVIIVDELTDEVLATIARGHSVLYLAKGDVNDKKGGKIAIGFSSIFWNTSWTRNQAPHTMGLSINPKHPLFKYFPTEVYSNYQWFDLISNSQAMILNDFEKDFKPILQPIDTWFENRKLAIGFETKMGKGKLFVCSIDLTTDIDKRTAAKQFKYSLLNYMNSASFAPKAEVNVEILKSIFK